MSPTNQPPQLAPPTGAQLKEAEDKSKAFRRSLYIARNMRAGEVLTRENLRIVRPGFGLPPKFFDLMLNKRIVRDAVAGTPLSWDLLG